MENVAALSSLNRYGENRHAVCGISILLKFITSKGILLRLVGCILMELLFSLSALFFFLPPPVHIFHSAAESLQNGTREQVICTTELTFIDIKYILQPLTLNSQLLNPNPHLNPSLNHQYACTCKKCPHFSDEIQIFSTEHV